MLHVGLAVLAALVSVPVTGTGPEAEAARERGSLGVAVTAITAEELQEMPDRYRPSEALRMVNANAVVPGGGRLNLRGLGTADLGTVLIDGTPAQTEGDWELGERIEVVAGARGVVFGTADQAATVCVRVESDEACRFLGTFVWEPGIDVLIDLVRNTVTLETPPATDRSGGWLSRTPFETLMVRGAIGLNRFHEESLDGFCDGAAEPCDVTTNQLGYDLAVEARMPLTPTVTAGFSVGWTDLGGAEIEVGDGPNAFMGYFRARALYGQANFYFDVLDEYPQVRPFALVGLARWSAESGSSAGSQSFSQDDSGTSLLFGAGVSYTGIGPGELGLSVRRTSLSSDEHAQSPVDNSVTQLYLGYSFALSGGR